MQSSRVIGAARQESQVGGQPYTDQYRPLLEDTHLSSIELSFEKKLLLSVLDWHNLEYFNRSALHGQVYG